MVVRFTLHLPIDQEGSFLETHVLLTFISRENDKKSETYSLYYMLLVKLFHDNNKLFCFK